MISAVRKTVREIYAFVGRQVVVLGAVSVLIGLFQFVVEMALAFSIQAFFRSLGLVGQGPAYFGNWFPYDNIYLVLGLLVVAGTVRGLITWGQTYITGIALIGFENRCREMLISWAFATREARIGEVADLFNDKAVGAANFVSSLLNTVSRVTVASMLALSLFKLSVTTTAVVLGILIVLVLPIRFLDQRIHALSDRLHKDIARCIERLLMGVKNSLLLHIYGTYRSEERLAQRSLDAYHRNYARYFFLSGLKGVLPPVFGVWMICVIALTARSIDPLPAPTVVSYLYLFLRFVQGLGELANLGSYITLTGPRMRTMWTWWRSAGEALRRAANLPAKAPEGEGRLGRPIGWDLKDVWVTYAGASGAALNNQNLRIEPGSTLVITGKSGSGKSTLLALLLGMLQPNGGRVSVFGKDGGMYPLSEVRQELLEHVGYVGPESFIIPGTIAENLHYGSERSYSKTEIATALELAGCQFVQDQAAGLDHMLTEQGEGLSAGQKQRLSLARALLRQPSALILDEATANLDAETEQRLIETLIGLQGKMTIVAVTHRVALTRIATQSLCLD